MGRLYYILPFCVIQACCRRLLYRASSHMSTCCAALKRFHECASLVSSSTLKFPSTPSSPLLSRPTIRFAPCQLRPPFAPPLPPLLTQPQTLAAKAHSSTASTVSTGTPPGPSRFPASLPDTTPLRP